MTEFTFADLMQVMLVLMKNKLLIVLVTAAGLFAGLLYTTGQTSAEYEYDATATLSVAFGQNLGQITGSTVITNYAEIVTSNLVGEYAAFLLAGEGLSGEDIQDMVSVSTGSNSFVLRITARDESPRTAIMVANAVAESFVMQVAVITGSNTVQVLDPARSAEIIYFGGTRIIRILAPAGAFVIVCGLLVVIELLSGKIRSVKQCIVDENELLTVIPQVKLRKSRQYNLYG